MRFCETCKQTKPFSIDKVQPVCDECTHRWIDVHSKQGKKTEEHKEALLDFQAFECALCLDAFIDAPSKGVYHEDDGYRYSVLCSKCASRFRLLNYDLSLIKGMIERIGFYAAHKEHMTVKDRKWLSVCENSGPLFSTCCKGQYFSVIVSAKGKLLSEGWNGVPPGEIHCNQGGCERSAEAVASNSPYENCLAQHAEVNAILNVAKEELEGATLYVNGTPCHECVRTIIHSGIKRVVFIPREEHNYVEGVSKMGLHGVSAVYIDDQTVLSKKKGDMISSMRGSYKTNVELVDDIDAAKKMLAYLRFNKMMSRVARCLQTKSTT